MQTPSGCRDLNIGRRIAASGVALHITVTCHEGEHSHLRFLPACVMLSTSRWFLGFGSTYAQVLTCDLLPHHSTTPQHNPNCLRLRACHDTARSVKSGRGGPTSIITRANCTDKRVDVTASRVKRPRKALAIAYWTPNSVNCHQSALPSNIFAIILAIMWGQNLQCRDVS
jgi:hypothetical protein